MGHEVSIKQVWDFFGLTASEKWDLYAELLIVQPGDEVGVDRGMGQWMEMIERVKAKGDPDVNTFFARAEEIADLKAA